MSHLVQEQPTGKEAREFIESSIILFPLTSLFVKPLSLSIAPHHALVVAFCRLLS
jgi:hypothetical protein